MELYRVSKRLYQTDLLGTGAFLAGGRWNTRGNYMLYTAGSRSLAILEVLVHLSDSQPHDDYSIVVLYIPDDIYVQQINTTTLSFEWRETYVTTRNIGDEWLQTSSSLLLKVPSAIVKAEYNYLINPQHPAFNKIQVLDYETLAFDKRLFGYHK